MPGLDVEVVPDAEALAARAATFVAARAREAVADHGRFAFAVSGGRTPWAMFADLGNEDVPWDAIELYQVDERVGFATDDVGSDLLNQMDTPPGTPAPVSEQALDFTPNMLVGIQHIDPIAINIEDAASIGTGGLPLWRMFTNSSGS